MTVITTMHQADGSEGLSALAEALSILREDGWAPPQQLSSREVNIHDALYEVTNGDFEAYIDAVELLNDELGEDVMLWEREPHRSEVEVVELFERIVNGRNS